MTDESESDNALNCSFCGKSRQEVRKLIAGPSVYICDECVELSATVISIEFPVKYSPETNRNEIIFDCVAFLLSLDASDEEIAYALKELRRSRKEFSSDSSQPAVSGLRRRPLPDNRASRLALTRTEIISRVADALCREWCHNLDDRSLRATRTRFWNQFMDEARIAIDAYLDALDEAEH